MIYLLIVTNTSEISHDNMIANTVEILHDDKYS